MGASASQPRASEATPHRQPDEITFLCLNTYLLPAAFVGEGNKTCLRQNERARRIGPLIAQCDIAVMQEVWGAAMADIEDGCAETHAPLPMSRSYRSWEFLDVAAQFIAGRGGLWQACRLPPPGPALGGAVPPVFCGERRHVFTVSKTHSRKCAHIARYTVADPGPTGGRCSLLVVNVHTDPMNVDGIIEAQVAEAAAFLRAALLDGDFMAGDGPQPENGKEQRCNTAVLLCGDFNLDLDSSVAQRCLGRLFGEWTDLMPVASRAPTYDHGRNSMVMWPQCARLDWQLSLHHLPGVGPLRRLLPRGGRVLRDEELSDHWPCLVTVAVKLESCCR